MVLLTTHLWSLNGAVPGEDLSALGTMYKYSCSLTHSLANHYTRMSHCVIEDEVTLMCMWCSKLVGRFHQLLTECGKLISPSCITFFIDGIDDVDNGHQATSLSWLPEKIPQVSVCHLKHGHFSHQYL